MAGAEVAAALSDSMQNEAAAEAASCGWASNMAGTGAAAALSGSTQYRAVAASCDGAGDAFVPSQSAAYAPRACWSW